MRNVVDSIFSSVVPRCSATDPKVAAAAREAFTACADRADKIFLSREYTKEAHMRVKEENGKYRPVTLFRHRIMRDRVVLNFGGGEFEGIELLHVQEQGSEGQ